jgi:23S rRNA pseudouridine1911/1915/1917 synthase
MSEFYRHIPADEFEDIASRILYEDNHLLIFNKRSGEIVQGDKTGDEPLSDKLKAFWHRGIQSPARSSWGSPTDLTDL